MEVERAQAIANVARVLVESAKTEVAFMKVVTDTGAGFPALRGSGFIPLGLAEEAKPTTPRLAGGAR